MSLFGDWTRDLEGLAKRFGSAEPFPHVIIPNFFSDEVAQRILSSFPNPGDDGYHWHHYDNPIEQKYALDDFSQLPYIRSVFDSLQSEQTVTTLRKITRISDLEADPHLHGAGLHAYPRRGKLDVHLDYCIHPLSGKERRCNLIVYLNPDWKPEYGGELELWDQTLSKKTNLVIPSWNTAVLFKTNDVSYHGLPRAVTCPEGEYRKSLAIYYVSPRTNNALPRFKALYHPTPEQNVSERMQQLYAIRASRRIEPEDLQLWPTWRSEGGEFW